LTPNRKVDSILPKEPELSGKEHAFGRNICQFFEQGPEAEKVLVCHIEAAGFSVL
jgi:hypothetical protein